MGVFINGVDQGGPASSTTQAGVIEVATAAEINTGTDAARAASPDALAGSNLGTRYVSVEIFPPGTSCETGDGKKFFHVPAGLNGMNLVEVHAETFTAGTTSTMIGMIHNLDNGCGANMLSTGWSIDTTPETGSDTAAAAAVIDACNDEVATNDLLRFDMDQVHSGTAAKGLTVTLGFRLP